MNLTAPPGRQPQQHHNEQVYAGAGAGKAGDGVAALFLEGDFGRSAVGDIFDMCFFLYLEY